MADFVVIADQIQWKQPEARRVVITLGNPPAPGDSAAWDETGRAIADQLVHQSALILVFVYPHRRALAWDGWIARIIAGPGRFTIYTDNDPDGRRALMESIRED